MSGLLTELHSFSGMAVILGAVRRVEVESHIGDLELKINCQDMEEATRILEALKGPISAVKLPGPPAPPPSREPHPEPAASAEGEDDGPVTPGDALDAVNAVRAFRAELDAAAPAPVPTASSATPAAEPGKRPRGRPRKNPLPVSPPPAPAAAQPTPAQKPEQDPQSPPKSSSVRGMLVPISEFEVVASDAPPRVPEPVAVAVPLAHIPVPDKVVTGVHPFDLAKVLECDLIADILRIMMRAGMESPEEILAECEKLKATVPILTRVNPSAFKERIAAILVQLGMDEASRLVGVPVEKYAPRPLNSLVR